MEAPVVPRPQWVPENTAPDPKYVFFYTCHMKLNLYIGHSKKLTIITKNKREQLYQHTAGTVT